MAQKILHIANYQTQGTPLPERATAVGLAYKDEVVTLRFMETLTWGQPVRQVRLDRDLAEQLSRLLNDELDDASWA